MTETKTVVVVTADHRAAMAECHKHGHDFAVVAAVGDDPALVICLRCAANWEVR